MENYNNNIEPITGSKAHDYELTDETIELLKTTVFKHFPEWCIKDKNNIIPPNTNIYIDEQNFVNSARLLHAAIDFKKLKYLFEKIFNVNAFYIFVSIVNDSLAETFNNLCGDDRTKKPLISNEPYVNWLNFNGFRVVSRQSKVLIDSSTNKPKLKGNIDVDLATTAMSTQHGAKHIILITGDGDFETLVKQLQALNKMVTVISTQQSSIKSASECLIKQSDIFLDFNNILPYIEREIE